MLQLSVCYQTSVCLLLYAPLLWRLAATLLISLLINRHLPDRFQLGNKKHVILAAQSSLTSQVNVSENPSTGEITVRHLSSHLAATEEVAQSLLFQGSTCRRVAETAMNQCSSRSHSIFTITLTTKTQGAEVITK